MVDTTGGQHVVGGTGLRDLFGEARLQPIDRGRASERCLYLCSDQHSARQHHLGDRRGVLEGLVAAHVVLPDEAHVRDPHQRGLDCRGGLDRHLEGTTPPPVKASPRRSAGEASGKDAA